MKDRSTPPVCFHGGFFIEDLVAGERKTRVLITRLILLFAGLTFVVEMIAFRYVFT